MRKVVAVEWISLDGVMESPEEWASPYTDDEMEEANASGRAGSDALLLGRRTYQVFADYWADQPSHVPIADYINNVPKFVVSTTLEEPLGWNNSTLIRGDVAEKIDDLKRRPGKNVTVLGSATLLGSLLREDLIDELRLMVHPVVLGNGKRLFENGGDRKAMELVDSKTFGTGVLYLTYRPSAAKVS